MEWIHVAAGPNRVGREPLILIKLYITQGYLIITEVRLILLVVEGLVNVWLRSVWAALLLSDHLLTAVMELEWLLNHDVGLVPVLLFLASSSIGLSVAIIGQVGLIRFRNDRVVKLLLRRLALPLHVAAPVSIFSIKEHRLLLVINHLLLRYL